MATEVPSMPRSQRREAIALALLAASVYLGLAAWLFFGIRHANQGHFLYALDDPYIHLALSQGIAHGHYGINPGEPASPSSSVLWPYFLAPFAGWSGQPFVPLLLNLLAGLGICALIGASIARWPAPAASPGGAAARTTERWRRALSALGLLLVGNLLGLAFIGMEHTLQVLLAGAGAWGITAVLRGRPIPLWVLAAVAIGPSVRYENLGITLAILVALAGTRRWRAAATLLAVSLAPLLLFSLYLHRLGLPWLPTSVMMKSRPVGGEVLHSAGLSLLVDNLQALFTDPQRVPLLLLVLSLAGLCWHERDRARRFALAGATLAGALHLAVGRFDWFHRYEVYIVFFSALILLHVVHERPRGLLGWYLLGLVGCSFPYLQALHEIVPGANQVYRQQYQTYRLFTGFYSGNIAVNDLGLVSYRRRPSTYVLDLWGLASADTAAQKLRSTAWLAGTVKRHHVGLVAIYPLWFPPVPSDWTPLGELCLNDPPIALGGSCVAYYATPQTDIPALQQDFADWVATLPPGVTIRLPGQPPLYR